MYILRLTTKIITPMFMSGADRRTPELRPSEFKGMIRWWWRALKAENDREKLYKEEAKIFGGIGKNEGKSKIIVRMISENLDIGEDIKKEISNFEGLKYLYYSTFALKSEGEHIIRKYYKPESKFVIELKSFEEKYFHEGIVSLWLAIYLGGFGTRARRGGGNLSVEKVEGNKSYLDFYCKAKNIIEFENWLRKNLENIKKNYPIYMEKNYNYTTLAKSRILIFGPHNCWKKALNFIGLKFKDFRNNKKNKIFETAIFGMPIMHKGFKNRIVPYENQRAQQSLSNRWASPIIFKVIESGDKIYFPVIVCLNPGGINYVGLEERKGKGENWIKKEVNKFSESILKDFINDIKPVKELSL